MKKLLALLVPVCLLLAACGGDAVTQTPSTEPVQSQPPGKEYPYDYTDPAIFRVENFPRYLPEANTVGPVNGAAYKFPGTEDGFTGAQAATCDGTYGYFALLNKTVIIDGEVTEGCRIRKVDLATFETVAISEPLPTNHTNGMTYNANTHKLIISNHRPEYNKLTIVNPDTLQLEQVITLEHGVQSIGYSAQLDRYAARLAGTWDFVVLDGDFREVGVFRTGVSTGMNPQFTLCDENYVYLMDTGLGKNPGAELITVYTWEGKFQGTYRIMAVQECEALLWYQDQLYVTFLEGSGGSLYRLEYDPSLIGSWQAPNE